MNHYAVENLFGIEGLNIAWYGKRLFVALMRVRHSASGHFPASRQTAPAPVPDKRLDRAGIADYNNAEIPE